MYRELESKLPADSKLRILKIRINMLKDQLRIIEEQLTKSPVKYKDKTIETLNKDKAKLLKRRDNKIKLMEKWFHIEQEKENGHITTDDYNAKKRHIETEIKQDEMEDEMEDLTTKKADLLDENSDY